MPQRRLAGRASWTPSKTLIHTSQHQACDGCLRHLPLGHIGCTAYAREVVRRGVCLRPCADSCRHQHSQSSPGSRIVVGDFSADVCPARVIGERSKDPSDAPVMEICVRCVPGRIAKLAVPNAVGDSNEASSVVEPAHVPRVRARRSVPRRPEASIHTTVDSDCHDVASIAVHPALASALLPNGPNLAPCSVTDRLPDDAWLVRVTLERDGSA
eukprot:1181601-Rhodomonas_salina.1